MSESFVKKEVLVMAPSMVKQIRQSQKLMSETPVEFGGTGEALKKAREVNLILRSLLHQSEEYVRAYKCQANPIATREDASKLLKQISNVLNEVSFDE